MERSTKLKLIFVVFIGFVMLVFMVKMFLFNERDKDGTEFEGDKDYIYTSPKEDESQTAEPQSKVENDQVQEGNTEIDYEAEYTEKFKEQKVKEARQLTEKVMQSWLENNTDMEMWEEISTAPFLIVVKNEVLAPKDQLTRKVKSQEISSTKSSGDNDIRFTIFATWDLLSSGNKVKEQSNMYELTLTLSESEEWLIKELNRV